MGWPRATDALPLPHKAGGGPQLLSPRLPAGRGTRPVGPTSAGRKPGRGRARQLLEVACPGGPGSLAIGRPSRADAFAAACASGPGPGQAGNRVQGSLQGGRSALRAACRCWGRPGGGPPVLEWWAPRLFATGLGGAEPRPAGFLSGSVGPGILRPGGPVSWAEGRAGAGKTIALSVPGGPLDRSWGGGGRTGKRGIWEISRGWDEGTPRAGPWAARRFSTGHRGSGPGGRTPAPARGRAETSSRGVPGHRPSSACNTCRRACRPGRRRPSVSCGGGVGGPAG